MIKRRNSQRIINLIIGVVVMKRVGLVGWRGMVGSVLMQRMLEEQDFDLIEPVFFTTSNVGGQEIGRAHV